MCSDDWMRCNVRHVHIHHDCDNSPWAHTCERHCNKLRRQSIVQGYGDSCASLAAMAPHSDHNSKQVENHECQQWERRDGDVDRWKRYRFAEHHAIANSRNRLFESSIKTTSTASAMPTHSVSDAICRTRERVPRPRRNTTRPDPHQEYRLLYRRTSRP